MKEIDQILELSLEAGRMMLESNSEIYRAEEVIVNICRAFGVKNIDVFTLATCIYLCVNIEGHTYTRIRRIYQRETNLARISKINDLSRSIVKNHYTLDQFKEKLSDVESCQGLPNWQRALTISASCGVFGIMFMPKANWIDFIVTFIITCFTYYLMQFLKKYEMNAFIANALLAILMTFLASMCVSFGIVRDIDTIVIGTIMILVPGVAVTNAVRDIINGDILSGTIRTVEALIIALGIAFGVGLTLFFSNIGGLL